MRVGGNMRGSGPFGLEATVSTLALRALAKHSSSSETRGIRLDARLELTGRCCQTTHVPPDKIEVH